MRAKSKNKLFGIFIGIQFILYVSFILLDFFHLYEISSVVKFITIVLCLLMSLGILVLYERVTDRVMLSIALSFTVLADVFLLFTEFYTIGVLSFCIVQTIYLARISRTRWKRERIYLRVKKRYSYSSGKVIFLKQLLLRILISGVIALSLIYFNVVVDTLLCVTLFYFISFMFNIVLTFNIKKRYPHVIGYGKWNLFLLGLLLFFACDLMVGMFNLSSYVSLPKDMYQSLYQIAGMGMWVFYLPGQVLITLS